VEKKKVETLGHHHSKIAVMGVHGLLCWSRDKEELSLSLAATTADNGEDDDTGIIVSDFSHVRGHWGNPEGPPCIGTTMTTRRRKRQSQLCRGLRYRTR